ncbi:MAG: ribonuclease HI family protein [Planctomycetota bacterium]
MASGNSPSLTVHIDGGARGNPGPAGVGVVVSADGVAVLERGYYLGETTNNVAEYTGLIRGIALAKTLSPASVTFISDSQLMVNQVHGRWKIKADHLRELCVEARSGLATLDHWELTHVRRELNRRADELANRAMDARADVEG